MKKNFLIFMICIQFQIVKSQVSTEIGAEIGKISLSVVMPENSDELDASQLAKLATKISQIVTNYGIDASSPNNNFVIYPKFTIYETNIVEGGMQNIIVVKSELSLFIKQVDNNILFASVSKIINGSGNNALTATTNALSKINVNDKEFKIFLEKSKAKIIQYYESKCLDIIEKAEIFAKKQDFQQALGLLMSVPAEAECYKKAQEKSLVFYKNYQDQECKKIIHEINLNVANNDYTGATENLKLIMPSSSCFEEAKVIITRIENKIDVAQKRQLALQVKVYEDKVALQKQRLDALKEIAIAQQKNRPKIYYNYIIR